MTRRIAILLLALLLALVAFPALAVTRLPKYAVVVGGVEQPLTAKTGYVFRSGSKLMIPMEETARALGLSYTTDEEKTTITITRADGVKVRLNVGSAWIRVGEKNKRLRMKTGRQDGSLITADVKVLGNLGAIFKHYKAGVKTKALGYPSGVLAIAMKGGDLTTIPEHNQTSDETALPDAAKEVAKTATQIVTVRYKGGSNAKLRLFTKKDGVWTSQFEAVNAYVGKNGIGKTKEGDKKTPTGAFNLTTPFGILAEPEDGAAMGGYLKVTKYHYWSGKSGSEYYNRLVDTRVSDYTPGKNDEHLIDYKGAYNYCFFIDYNADGEAGLGSAIFLHCTGSSKSTAGCVAVSQSVMEKLMLTLKAGAKIVIYE